MSHTENEIPLTPFHSHMKQTDKWRIPWEKFETVLGLKTHYDLRQLNLYTTEDAINFSKNCGFDVKNAQHLKEFERFLGEALFFIRHQLMTEEERLLYPIPEIWQKQPDPIALLLTASERSPRRRYIRLLACALLKVIHVIANAEYSGKLVELENAKEDIFSKINKLLKEKSTLILHPKQKTEPIRLAQVDWKESKSRQSLLMKLILKPDSVLDEVFDYLGVRFVVYDLNDIPKLLKILIESDIIIPHQVVNIRTKNTILEIPHTKRVLQFCQELLSSAIINENEFEMMCRNIDWSLRQAPQEIKRANLFSNEHYRSLQITVRHLFRIPNQAFQILESFANQLRKYRVKDRYEPWIENMIPPSLARYIPIEIQIMDQESYQTAQFGQASHEQYKRLQLEHVRKKILGSLIKFNAKRLETQIISPEEIGSLNNDPRE